jgi:hypothetical protein
VLTAQFLSLPPGVHHMKLAIADASDPILDSAVFIEAGSFTFSALRVPVDIHPGSCPNPLNVNRRGVLPVAIAGTDEIDVTTIDPHSIRLQGVPPLRWSYSDVTTPQAPFMGKEGCLDCNTLGPDGHLGPRPAL